MRKHCDICGNEADEYWMRSYDIGCKTIWLCWDCYKTAQREATISDVYRGKKLHKIAVSKKRNK